MSSQEHVPGNENTDVLPGHGWSQFGTTPPQHGQYSGYQAYGVYGNQGPYDTAVMPGPPQRPRVTLTGRQKAGAGLALVAVALGGGVAGALVANAANGGQTVISSPIVNPASNSSANTVAEVAKAIMPSVVSIKVTTATGGGEGSGVILSADGLILTNNHVVSEGGGASQVTVKFSDGRTATATVKGTDPLNDLAVIQAQGVSGLTPASLGDSDKLQVGDSVLAIGSPLGLEGSVTSGIVSALDRTLTEGNDQPQTPQFPWGMDQQPQPQQGATIGGMIQTDAAINPGNSGGALVNASGQVVGINTAIATSGQSSGNIGVGFAIPINTAKVVSEQLIKTGKATHAYLGVTLADATGGVSGAVVSSVTAGSPAEKAGLKEGDLITKINDTPVDGAETLVGVIRTSRPGDKVTLTYQRNGNTATITAALAEQSATG
ncbi:trypsin-like peptidase domain-containing protein [Microbispora sp. RL4-1S]|uniref:Trypsin-like peptidase domain-containing protein n=1 Tax=Microbispora oryzae TaxID=2806554 RepID=A0A941AIN9_9ACTN|nr:trypsin-like peptidase domain-containing protein [Microbispora oryzae]MBP2704082.1 trypsin-like peptidase domain-containing protein [Microbispora oryzae]